MNRSGGHKGIEEEPKPPVFFARTRNNNNDAEKGIIAGKQGEERWYEENIPLLKRGNL